jgi:hypothetical protein
VQLLPWGVVVAGTVGGVVEVASRATMVLMAWQQLLALMPAAHSATGAGGAAAAAAAAGRRQQQTGWLVVSGC